MPIFGWGSNKPEIKPVAQGGDTIAIYTQKVKNAISDLFDTLNTFPWANATQSSSGFMSKDDKKVVDGIADLGTFNKMFFSQTSGTFTAPRTGVYRITLKGGGGGGQKATTDTGGCSGGEGGLATFYASLTKNESYQYVIGAGGAGGTETNGAAGADGGTSKITINNTEFLANGGGGGQGNTYLVLGGVGYMPSPFVGYIERGAPGNPGGPTADSAYATGGMGGGRGGGTTGSYPRVGVYGGGGGGGAIRASEARDGGTGGDGYILIEYAG